VTRRASLASFLIPVALIVPLFALGAVLDWPEEAFGWVGLGAALAGMLIAYVLFYEEPPDTLESLDRLSVRVDALERQARENPVGQATGRRTPAEASTPRTRPHS
jgi:hypothetical protein